MNKSCLKYTAIPGTSRLFSDYLYHFDRVSRYYDWDPFSPASFASAAAQIQFPAERRCALAQALREQNPEARNLALLEAQNGVAVVTGQQVGLFSGPAYTVFKAITAARLAQRLTTEGIPAVPIFWLATEDHDLAEVDHAWVFDSAVIPARLNAVVRSTGGPVGETVLEDVPIDQLARALDGFAYGAEVVDIVQQAYKPGAKLGGAFHELLQRLLQPLGIIFLDPLKPAFRQIVSPFLAEAVHRTPDILRVVQQRNDDLAQNGYHSQVFVDANTSPFFLLDRGQRVAFKWKAGQFTNKQIAYSPGDLQGRAADISPNALLRPVMQDFALPTVAYVGGPAEVAYLAQCQPLYRELLGRMPVIVPRNGFTLLDERSVKLLNQYSLDVAGVLCPEAELQSRLARCLVPADVKMGLARAHGNVAAEIAQVETVLEPFDPTLKAALVKSGAKIRYQLDKITKKVEREIFRRDQQAIRAAERLTNAIYPHQHLQERMYTILPFLAQHGPDLISRLSNATQLNCPDHMVRAVAELS
jgi:bacillithiol biosynthesis cysteine-adding enzyme BshC